MEGNNKQLVETLTRGRNSAKKLQNLLSQKVSDKDLLVTVDHVVTEITQSFYAGLLLLNSGTLGRAPVTSYPSSSRKKIKNGFDTDKTHPPAVKGRRGCYKRRMTTDSRMELSSTTEDGYTWRKYGQKDILNSKFPRCYFRCSHKQVHGCKALKQVQQLEDGSNMYHIIYFGYHSCPPTNTTSSHPANDFHCKRSSKESHYLQSNPKTITNYHIDLSATQEDVSSKDSSASGGAQSPPSLAWKEILRTEFEYVKNDGCFSDISFDDFFFP